MTLPNTGPYQTAAGANYLDFDESFGSALDEIFDEGDGGNAVVPAPPRYVDPSGAVIQSGYASAYLGASAGAYPGAYPGGYSGASLGASMGAYPAAGGAGGRGASPPAPFAAPPVPPVPPAPPAPAARSIAPPLPAPSGQNNLVMRSPKGTVRELRPLGAHYANESRAAGGTVKYLDVLRRMKYAVTLGQRIIRKVDGRILDTKEVYKHYRAHRAAKLGRADLGSARWGKGKGGQDFAALPEWKGTALIWVCLPDPRSDEPCFFTHVCKIEKFHHSSFGGGSAVIGAGEWVVNGGKLLYISANSGHYRPDLTIFHNSVLQMTAAFSGDTQVLMYDSVADSWVHRPVMQFIRSPSGNGRYKTHPEA